MGRDGPARAAAPGSGPGSVQALGMRWSGSGGAGAGAGAEPGAAAGEQERGQTGALTGDDLRARPCLPHVLGSVKGLVSSAWFYTAALRCKASELLVLELLCNPHPCPAGPVRPVGAAPTGLSKIHFSRTQTR